VVGEFVARKGGFVVGEIFLDDNVIVSAGKFESFLRTEGFLSGETRLVLGVNPAGCVVDE
jgi:hypothetical protein